MECACLLTCCQLTVLCLCAGCCGSCCSPWCFCVCCWSPPWSCWCWLCACGSRAEGMPGGRGTAAPRWPFSTPTVMLAVAERGCSGVPSGLYRTGKSPKYFILRSVFSFYFGVPALSLPTSYWLWHFQCVVILFKTVSFSKPRKSIRND